MEHCCGCDLFLTVLGSSCPVIYSAGNITAQQSNARRDMPHSKLSRLVALSPPPLYYGGCIWHCNFLRNQLSSTVQNLEKWQDQTNCLTSLALKMSVTLFLFAYAWWLLLCNIVLHKRTNSQFKQTQDCTNNAIVAELNVVDAQKNVGIRNSNVLRKLTKWWPKGSHSWTTMIKCFHLVPNHLCKHSRDVGPDWKCAHKVVQGMQNLQGKHLQFCSCLHCNDQQRGHLITAVNKHKSFVTDHQNEHLHLYDSMFL
jgi:hypothetical protein